MKPGIVVLRTERASQVLTAPYHVVRLRRGPERATLARRLVTDDC